MDENLLRIHAPIHFDESISHYEHQPYTSASFNNSDEIRIAINQSDLCLLPSKSSLHVYGRLLLADGTGPTVTTNLVNHAIYHLFEEIRYELNAVEIDRNKNVSLTSLMKGYLSLAPGQNSLMENAN